jgi:putative ABC transport system permease protein
VHDCVKVEPRGEDSTDVPYTARLLTSLLYGVNPLDPVTFIALPLLLGGAVMLATWLPARRASRTSPMQALRAE